MKYVVKMFLNERGPVSSMSFKFDADSDTEAIKKATVAVIAVDTPDDELVSEIMSEFFDPEAEEEYLTDFTLPTTAEELREFNLQYNGDDVDFYYLANLSTKKVLFDESDEAEAFYQGDSY
jgi:hypothetical protein